MGRFAGNAGLKSWGQNRQPGGRREETAVLREIRHRESELFFAARWCGELLRPEKNSPARRLTTNLYLIEYP
jgi:hypothetical protein